MKKRNIIIAGYFCLTLWLLTAVHIRNTRIIPGVGLSDETLDKLIIVKTGNRFLPGFENVPGFDNALTNAELFSLADQKLIGDIYSKISSGTAITNRYRTANNDGYDLFCDRLPTGEFVYLKISQVKHGATDGLVVKIGSNGRCVDWKRYSNGLAVDKWLLWDERGNLFRYIKFKESYDFQMHTHWRFKIQITLPWPWNDKTLLTTAWP